MSPYKSQPENDNQEKASSETIPREVKNIELLHSSVPLQNVYDQLNNLEKRVENLEKDLNKSQEELRTSLESLKTARRAQETRKVIQCKTFRPPAIIVRLCRHIFGDNRAKRSPPPVPAYWSKEPGRDKLPKRLTENPSAVYGIGEMQLNLELCICGVKYDESESVEVKRQTLYEAILAAQQEERVPASG